MNTEKETAYKQQAEKRLEGIIRDITRRLNADPPLPGNIALYIYISELGEKNEKTCRINGSSVCMTSGDALVDLVPLLLQNSESQLKQNFIKFKKAITSKDMGIIKSDPVISATFDALTKNQ